MPHSVRHQAAPRYTAHCLFAVLARQRGFHKSKQPCKLATATVRTNKGTRSRMQQQATAVLCFDREQRVKRPHSKASRARWKNLVTNK